MERHVSDAQSVPFLDFFGSMVGAYHSSIGTKTVLIGSLPVPNWSVVAHNYLVLRYLKVHANSDAQLLV